MNSEWQTKLLEFPNTDYNCLRTSIAFGSLVASYYHVEGGFKLDRYHKRAKLYAVESEIRIVLLRKMLAESRKAARNIKAAIDAAYL